MQSSFAPPVDGEVTLPVAKKKFRTISWPDERERVLFRSFLLWHIVWQNKKKLRLIWTLWSFLANPLVEAVATIFVTPDCKEDQLLQQWDMKEKRREDESKAKVLRSWYEQTASGGAGSSSK